MNGNLTYVTSKKIHHIFSFVKKEKKQRENLMLQIQKQFDNINCKINIEEILNTFSRDEWQLTIAGFLTKKLQNL